MLFCTVKLNDLHPLSFHILTYEAETLLIKVALKLRVDLFTKTRYTFGSQVEQLTICSSLGSTPDAYTSVPHSLSLLLSCFFTALFNKDKNNLKKAVCSFFLFLMMMNYEFSITSNRCLCLSSTYSASP